MGEFREVGFALLFVGVAALLRLLAAVEEEVSVVGKLLDAGVAVLVGVEARFQETQRERRSIQHLPAPADGLVLECGERHDRVDESHLQRLPGGIHPAEEPHLLRLLRPDEAGENRSAETAVEAADPRTDLPELRVVSGDGEVAHHVQDVASADGVPCHHRNDGLGAAPDLDVQIRNVEAPDRLPSRCATRRVRVLEVSGVSSYLLIPTRAESVRPLPRQDDDPRLVIFAGVFEGPLHLDDRQRTKSVPYLGAVYGDLRNPLRLLVPDILELSNRFPLYVSHAADYMGSKHP